MTSSADGTGGGANFVIVAESLQAFCGALAHLQGCGYEHGKQHGTSAEDTGGAVEYIFGTLRWSQTV